MCRHRPVLTAVTATAPLVLSAGAVAMSRDASANTPFGFPGNGTPATPAATCAA
ncbi:hypothetical protein [Streptosporangium sp. NPDC006930]|uniref:hypothetical protein n=1 Tax=unclassified Streptosporangium TaxID=2632669 RepID=UPI00342529FA